MKKSIKIDGFEDYECRKIEVCEECDKCGECECYKIIVCEKDCDGGNGGCTYTQGHWKTHGPVGCNPSAGSNEWPVNMLNLGIVVYSDTELCSIFQQPVGGNGLISLAHQLIAAKLNIENGADSSPIQDTIDAADLLIGALVVPPVGVGFLAPATTSALTTLLDSYNNGLLGVPHCE